MRVLIKWTLKVILTTAMFSVPQAALCPILQTLDMTAAVA